MKSDLDSMMEARHIDAILVTGPAQHNPAMVYLTGGGHVTQADLIKKRGEPAVLFHGSMEREEAARTGLICRAYSNYPTAELLKETNGDRLMAQALRYRKMLADVGVTSGKVAIYGQVELGPAFSVFSAFDELLPGISLVGYQPEDLLGSAMFTKDIVEIERIKRMGQITTDVVAKVADMLSGRKVSGDVLIRPDGEPLTIGNVKSQINLWLAEAGAENPEGTIFAIGHDAGVPHSTGTNSDPLRVGETIVFDIFPCEAGGGYFYDFTRTWCLGHATDEALQLYEQVLSVYKTVVSELETNAPFSRYQKRTCELFESMGHLTVMSSPDTENGYVHSLGHGVGLLIHERPGSGMTATPNDVLAPGTVFTIEPGLYYPERNLGVRLEDTYWVTPDGRFELFAPYPMDLVIPLKA